MRPAGRSRCSISNGTSVAPADPVVTAGRCEDLASVFAALGDATRLRLVTRLSADGPMSITRLTAGSSVTRQAVTKHLQVLAETGLARSQRLGRQAVWSLEIQRLQDARACIDNLSAQWDQELARLRDFVER